MLESFRKANQSWFIKILFAFLILSFGVWGVGDVIRGRVAATPAISVGDTDISAAEVADRFRQDVERMSKAFGQKLSTEQAIQFGLLQRTVNQMVDASLFDAAASRLRLGVDDETLRRTIAAIPAFQSQLKIFDKLSYQRALASLNMTEKQFVALERADLARDQLVKIITAGVAAPEALAAPVYRYQNEKRVAETITVEADKMPPAAVPDDATLQKFYDGHKARFQQPELRAITALVVREADLAATVKPGDDEVEKAYQARLGEYQTAEKRHIQQVLFTDAAQAEAFLDKVKGGQDFIIAAQKQGLSVTDLGSVSKRDMPIAELADAAFAGGKTGAVGPVQSTLGWHALLISDIQPQKTRPLAEVRAEIVQSLIKDEATNRLYSLSTKLEDSIGGGNDVLETAKMIGVPATRITAVDDQGRDAEGHRIEAATLSPPLLATAFQTVQGGTSDVLALPNNDGYYVVHVDQVTPATIRPFDSVKAQCLAAWQTEQRAAAAKQRAETLAQRLRQGENPATFGADVKLEISKPMMRTAGAGVAAGLPAALFRLDKVGDVAVVSVGADAVVARLREILVPDVDSPNFTAARNELSESVANDLLQEYGAALKKDFGVTVNMSVIQQQFAK